MDSYILGSSLSCLVPLVVLRPMITCATVFNHVLGMCMYVQYTYGGPACRALAVCNQVSTCAHVFLWVFIWKISSWWTCTTYVYVDHKTKCDADAHRTKGEQKVTTPTWIGWGEALPVFPYPPSGFSVSSGVSSMTSPSYTSLFSLIRRPIALLKFSIRISTFFTSDEYTSEPTIGTNGTFGPSSLAIPCAAHILKKNRAVVMLMFRLAFAFILNQAEAHARNESRAQLHHKVQAWVSTAQVMRLWNKTPPHKTRRLPRCVEWGSGPHQSDGGLSCARSAGEKDCSTSHLLHLDHVYCDARGLAEFRGIECDGKARAISNRNAGL